MDPFHIFVFLKSRCHHSWVTSIHLFLAVKMGMAFVNSMSLASGLIRVQLFIAVQKSSFCCLILNICVSYDIILMYYLNYEHTGL